MLFLTCTNLKRRDTKDKDSARAVSQLAQTNVERVFHGSGGGNVLAVIVIMCATPRNFNVSCGETLQSGKMSLPSTHLTFRFTYHILGGRASPCKCRHSPLFQFSCRSLTFLNSQLYNVHGHASSLADAPARHCKHRLAPPRQ